MSEPTPGEIYDDGLLRKKFVICSRCGNGHWRLATSKKTVCNRCKTGRRDLGE